MEDADYAILLAATAIIVATHVRNEVARQVKERRRRLCARALALVLADSDDEEDPYEGIDLRGRTARFPYRVGDAIFVYQDLLANRPHMLDVLIGFTPAEFLSIVHDIEQYVAQASISLPAP